MITFYYHPSPNPAKVALFLEESALPYELVLVDTHKGEQHDPAYLAINPNGKTPAMVDGAVTIFDSNAILLHLAERSGLFLPPDTVSARAELYSWLMFVASGLAPYTGQYAHFKIFAPKGQEYALNRYEFEAWRHWNIIDAHLARNRFMLGADYTILDMAVWGWARILPFVLGDAAWEKLPHVKRLLDDVNQRPAAQRAEALASRLPYKSEIDEDARRMLFPQNARLAA